MPDDTALPTAEEDEHFAAELQEFVYGTLTVLVAIGGLTGSQLPPEPRKAIAVIVGVAFATLLAHSFSALIALHVRTRRPVRRFEAVNEFRHSWRIVTATFPAVAMFVLAGLGVFSTRTALRLSTCIAVLALVLVGIVASRRAQNGLAGTIVFVGLATLMGLTIVAIELFVHHL